MEEILRIRRRPHMAETAARERGRWTSSSRTPDRAPPRPEWRSNGRCFTDTIASINTSGLLGEVYIGLDAGGDPVMLKDGDRIFKTQSAVVIEKLISQFLFDKASSGEASAPGKAMEKPAGETKK